MLYFAPLYSFGVYCAVVVFVMSLVVCVATMQSVINIILALLFSDVYLFIAILYVIILFYAALYYTVLHHIGMYCMERVGIRHDVKSEVLEFLQSARAHSAAEYFGGWDPRMSAPPMQGNIEVTSNLPISHYRAFSNSLIHAFYADRVGLSLGLIVTK